MTRPGSFLFCHSLGPDIGTRLSARAKQTKSGATFSVRMAIHMNIIKSAVVGLLLVVASCVLLFWAEGRAVNTARALEEGAGLVVDVDGGAPDAVNDGKLVHITGDVKALDTPSDSRLGIMAEGAVILKRKVEMLQWKEIAREVERTGNDGKTVKTTVYDYETAWSSSPIDSRSFKAASAPSNPAMPIQGDTFVIRQAMVGGFSVAGDELSGLTQESPVKLTDASTGQAAAAVGETRPMWLVNNMFVSAADPDQPQVGDLRISYARGDVSRASIVAKQQGGKLVPFTTSNGRDLFLSAVGDESAAAMFKTAMDQNVVITWLLRGGGIIVMFIGFAMSFAPLTQTIGQIPVIGGLVRGGAFLVGLVMTLLLGASVIAAGWFFFRPLLSIVILLTGVGLAYLLSRMGRKKQAGAALPAKA
jgi:hypothetical protein